MIRSELAVRLQAQNAHLYSKECEAVVNTILATMSDALAQGDRVELRGFGAFTVVKRPPRAGRNPRTGAPIAVAARRFVYFKTGKEMRERLKPQEPKLSDEVSEMVLERG